MSRINILNASVEDFKIEVVASAPSSGSSGDNADGRLVKYGKHIYVWQDSTGSWAQFGNASDISSLETRLSTQEAEHDSDISSLESKDSSLETRISSEEVSRAAAVSSEASRAASAEGSLETRLSSEEVARAADVDAEESRALVAEGSVETRLSVEESARVVAVDSLEARASGEEASLTTRASSEESAEASAEASLNTRMAAEESVRLANDGSLETAIAAEGSSRAAADTSLETRLSIEEDRVDAILNASSADKDTFVEIVSFINSVDVAHDSQTSSEISSIDSSIAAEESSRLAADNSLETRLSVEESNEAAAEVSLNARMSSEESVEASAEASLDLRMSSEESARLAADNSLATSVSGAGSSRVSGDSSLTTRISSEEANRQNADDDISLGIVNEDGDRTLADSSLQTRLSSEEVNRAAAVSSEASSRTAADSSLELRLSSEESTRAVGDASVQVLISSEESSRLAADNSLETRLSTEESTEAYIENSLETRISVEESVMLKEDDSIETRFSGEISTEKSRIDAILDSADADKDTFVEIVSFITAVDTESDDALASYVVSIDAAISSEASSESSAEASLNTVIQAADSVRKAAIDSLEAAHSVLISAQDSSIVVLENNEAARHLRIDFTNQTSFSVAAVDLPAGFTAGNGMVQIFHEVTTGTYRHLVAPATYNPSTGAMSFDLGATAKDGFAVFYSFAGDETSVSELLAYTTMAITSISSFSPGTLSSAASVVFGVSGISADNVSDHHNLVGSNIRVIHGGRYLTGSGSFNAGYTEWTISWTNDSSVSFSSSSQTYIELDNTNATSYPTSLSFTWDSTNSNAISVSSGLGYALDQWGQVEVSPGYFDGILDAYNSYDTLKINSGKYNRGPSYTLSTADLRAFQAAGNYYFSGTVVQQNYSGIIFFNYNSVDYYAAFGNTSTIRNSMLSTYSSDISGLTQYNTTAKDYRMQISFGGTPNLANSYLLSALLLGVYENSSSVNTTFPAPATDSITIIIDNPADDWGSTNVAAAADTAMKLVINKNAGSMSVTMSRLSGGNWVSVDRGYIGPHDPS